LRSPLPTEFNPSVLSSVYTDDQIPSVYTNGITDKMLRIKKRAVRWRGGYCRYFLPMKSPRDSKRQLHTAMWPIHRWKCRRNHRGIQNVAPYGDLPCLPSDQMTKSQTEYFCWWIRRQKLIYPHSTDPLLPYFSFFFPIPTLPNCKQPAPPKKISLFSAQ
jgi:hypothetical protein